MRALKSSERRLVLLFLGLIFLVVNLFVLERAVGMRREMEAELRKLKLEKAESDFWLSQKSLWAGRKAWLDEKQPKLKGTGQESAELLENIQQGARQQKITITDQTIAETASHPHYTAIAVQLQVKGSLEAISRWLASLQSPEAFQAVSNLTLKKDAEGSNIICNLTVAKYYATP